MRLLRSIAFATSLWMSACVAPRVPLRDSSQQVQQTEDRIGDNERPSYLQELPSAQEIANMSPIERIVEQYFQETKDFGGNIPRIIFSNGSPRRQVNVNGHQVLVELPTYRYVGQNTIRNPIDGTVDNADQVFNDLQWVLQRSNNMVMNHFRRIDESTNQRVRRRVGSLEHENIGVEGLEGVTVGEALGIQHHTNQDLLPRRLILVPMRSAYAMTRLHENIISYSPVSRKVDEIWGNPGIMGHEMWHLSQSLIDAMGTDVEMLAFGMDIDSFRNNPLEFLSHPYGDTVRELASAYHGFDSDFVLDSLLQNRMGAVIELDEDILNANYQQMVRLAGRFSDELHNEVEPEYRSFSPYWIMMQNYYRDENMMLRVAVARNNEPVAMTPGERREFVRRNLRTINRIIAETNNEYRMPRITNLGPFRFISGTTIDDLIEKKCEAAGFSDAQTEYVFHVFLRRNFLNRDGSYNYSNISLKNAIEAMSDFVKDLDFTEEELQRYFPNTRDDLKNQVALYNWYMERLKTAEKYQSFVVRQGHYSSPKFCEEIFDPRIDLERFYSIVPSYTRLTSNTSLQGSSRIVHDGQRYVIRNYDLARGVGYNNGVDYISVFRIKNDGSQESEPCIVVFAGDNSRYPNFALFDKEKEGEKGYGSYDFIENIGERLHIDSLLNTLSGDSSEIPIPPPLMPQVGHFQLPFDYHSWQKEINEYDSNLDNRIDSVAITYQNEDKSVREIYLLPENYDGARVLEDRIILTQRGVFEFRTLESLRNPDLVQVIEDGSITTYFDSEGNGSFRRRIR